MLPRDTFSFSVVHASEGMGGRWEGVPSFRAGELQAHSALSQAHLLTNTEMLLTRHLWKGVALAIGSKYIQACICWDVPEGSSGPALPHACWSTLLLHRRAVILTVETDGDFSILQIGFVEAILVWKERSAFSSKLLFIAVYRNQL